MPRPSLTQDAFLASLLAAAAVGTAGCSRAEPSAVREPAAVAPAAAPPKAAEPAPSSATAAPKDDVEEKKKANVVLPSAPAPTTPAAAPPPHVTAPGAGGAAKRDVAGPSIGMKDVPDAGGRTRTGSASCGAGMCSPDMKKPR